MNIVKHIRRLSYTENLELAHKNWSTTIEIQGNVDRFIWIKKMSLAEAQSYENFYNFIFFKRICIFIWSRIINKEELESEKAA